MKEHGAIGPLTFVYMYYFEAGIDPQPIRVQMTDCHYPSQSVGRRQIVMVQTIVLSSHSSHTE
jgi:hypothetical protein